MCAYARHDGGPQVTDQEMGGGGGGWAREGGERGALKPGERADGQAARLTLTSRHPLEQPAVSEPGNQKEAVDNVALLVRLC